jgi:hypothetical protein
MMLLSTSYNSQCQILGDFLSTSTTINLGWNFIDDNAQAYNGLFKKDSYLTYSLPSKISIIKPIEGKIRAALSIGYTKMQPEYYRARYLAPGHFLICDLNFRYQWNIINSQQFRMGMTRNLPGASVFSTMAISAFPVVGLGYTSRSQTVFDRTLTGNFGLGATFWLQQNKSGVTLEMMAKIGIEKPVLHAGSNYFHHSISYTHVIKSKTNYRRGKRTKIIKSRQRI